MPQPFSIYLGLNQQHGKGVYALIISRLNEHGFNGPGMSGVQEENN
jgi:PII-like signaling protein